MYLHSLLCGLYLAGTVSALAMYWKSYNSDVDYKEVIFRMAMATVCIILCGGFLVNEFVFILKI